MQAIIVRDRDAGVGGLFLTEMPYPHASQNDVIVRVVHPRRAGLGGNLGRPRRARPERQASQATICQASWLSWGTEPPALASASGSSG